MIEFLLFNVYFLVMALLYRLLFDKKGVVEWNRWLLLGIPIVLMLVVLLNGSFMAQSNLYLVEFDVVNISRIANTEQLSFGSFSFMKIIGTIYLLGLLTSIGFHLINFIKIYSIIRKSKFLKLYNGCRLYETDFNASFFNIIFIKRGLSSRGEEIILTHEYAHIRQKHSFDRVFGLIIQSVCWFNPAVYLWNTDIEKNHEYLADREVLCRVTKEDYTLFLLEQRLNLNLNQLRLPLSNMSNLKSRVMRMNGRTRSVMSYLILPAIAVGMMSSKIVPETKVELSTSKTEVMFQNEGKPVENPDEMPEFVGGTSGLMNFIANEVRYPEQSMKNNSSGKVFVEAVITENGKVTKVKVLKGVDKYIDAEAVRVFKAMPDWIPAKKDNKKVACAVRVPINFTFDKKGKSEPVKK